MNGLFRPFYLMLSKDLHQAYVAHQSLDHTPSQASEPVFLTSPHPTGTRPACFADFIAT